MTTAVEVWKKWEGQVVEGKFPLRRWLGGSDHSAVFLTERSGKESQKAAIKLLPAGRDNAETDAQFSRWADAAKLSHPHLLQLFERGQCQIDNARLLYVVMEYAEENLGEILPLRPLAPAEASDMLPPTADALVSLHRAGFVHSRMKPSNIMAVDNHLKISADAIRKSGYPVDGFARSAYDAPEIPITGATPAADIWSLGVILVAALAQNEPKLKSGEPVAVPETIPRPFRDIARRCLQLDPQRRCTAGEILSQMQSSGRQSQVAAGLKPTHVAKGRQKRWFIMPIVVAVVFVVALLAIKFMGHQPTVPGAENRPPVLPAESPTTHSPAPFSENASGNQKPAQQGLARGSVLQQVLPDVSRGAQNTITGHVRVSVQVEVDASGNVSQAKFISPGPSKYFANHALEAARRWKFNPPQVDGKEAPSEWILRFQFGRADTQVLPTETKP